MPTPGTGRRTLVTALAETVASLGDAPAYSDKVLDRVGNEAGSPGGGWRTLTWRQLHADVLDAAAGLIARGVEAGDRVAIMAGNRNEHVLADLAAVHAGAVPMSVYATFSTRQIDFIAEHAEPSLLVAEGAVELAAWQRALDRSAVTHTVVVLDPDLTPADPRFLSWADLVALGREYSASRPAVVRERSGAIDPDDPVTILYTSGSTGEPKGVLISHANMWFAAVGTGPAEISTGPDTVSYLPYAHISERLLGMYIPQTSGGHVHQVEKAGDVHSALLEVRPHLFFGVPRVWEKIAAEATTRIASAAPQEGEPISAALATGLAWVEAQQFGHRCSPELETAYAAADAEWLRALRAQLGLDRVVWAGVGGAPMPLGVTRFLAGLGLVVHDIYGMTETTASISASGTEDFRIGSVGRPPEGNQVRVAADGELLVKGPAVSAGYYRRADATSELFDDDGWLRTGDIGRVDEDGFVYITDRKKELIITSLGKNIAPSNVESLLTRHPIIGQAVVSGDGRPYLVALLSLEPSAAGRYADPESEVAKAVAAANAELSVPEQVKRYAVVPGEWSPETGELTATLKLRRRHLHTAYAEVIAALYASE